MRSGVYAVAPDGTYSNLVSKAHGDVDWSADGRFITFTSEAANLVENDTNALTDFFLRDRSAELAAP